MTIASPYARVMADNMRSEFRDLVMKGKEVSADSQLQGKKMAGTAKIVAGLFLAVVGVVLMALTAWTGVGLVIGAALGGVGLGVTLMGLIQRSSGNDKQAELDQIVENHHINEAVNPAITAFATNIDKVAGRVGESHRVQIEALSQQIETLTAELAQHNSFQSNQMNNITSQVYAANGSVTNQRAYVSRGAQHNVSNLLTPLQDGNRWGQGRIVQ